MICDKFGFSIYHEIIVVELRQALRRYFDLWEDVLDHPEEQRDEYAGDLEARRITVIVLSSALVEYVANFFLSIQCEAKQFAKLDRESLLKKWTTVPKQFNPEYCLPPESGIEDDLKRLIARRKAIVHARPKISMDDDGKHEGNQPELKWDEHEFVGRCVTLPYRLVENLFKYFMAIYDEFSSVQTYCGVVWGEFQAGQQRIMVASKYPRELIQEIMSQGFDRRTAVTCAIFIMDKRETDAEGNIIIRHGKTIKLKPLKFFEKKSEGASPSAIGPPTL